MHVRIYARSPRSAFPWRFHYGTLSVYLFITEPDRGRNLFSQLTLFSIDSVCEELFNKSNSNY